MSVRPKLPAAAEVFSALVTAERHARELGFDVRAVRVLELAHGSPLVVLHELEPTPTALRRCELDVHHHNWRATWTILGSDPTHVLGIPVERGMRP